MIKKLWKIFECSCRNGFTGDFCEFKAEHDHLLFVATTVSDFENRFADKLVFNSDGRLIGESASIGENSGAYRSCSTILNGEAIIFGGFHDESTNIYRQVNTKIIEDRISSFSFLSYRFRLFLNVEWIVWVTCHLILPLVPVKLSWLTV